MYLFVILPISDDEIVFLDGCVLVLLQSLLSDGLQFPSSSVVVTNLTWVCFLGFWLNKTSYVDIHDLLWYCVVGVWEEFCFPWPIIILYVDQCSNELSFISVCDYY